MISIVMPVPNEEKALPVCLRSLREQDYYGDFEILIADNGSTDGSAGLRHDGYGKQHGNADKSLAVATLGIIIKELQTQGYRFVTVPQLFGVAAYNSPG